MATIRKVTPDSNEPNACAPIICTPAQSMRCTPDIVEIQQCSPSLVALCKPAVYCTPHMHCLPEFIIPKRTVSGTYKSPAPASGQRIDLRVDVDARRPQDMLSGDFFDCGTLCGTPIEFYNSSFVVETVTINWVSTKVTITGQIKYYSNTGINTHSIEVEIPRVSIFSAAPSATVKFYIGATLDKTYTCAKSSEFFRSVNLEVDSFTGTAFPPDVGTTIDPHPADITDETISCAESFRRAGVDMTVNNDQTLTDTDSTDTGTTWNYGELHDLMETRFSDFANSHQWNVYGVIVPRMSGDVAGSGYNNGLYGVMFDFGTWQAGDTFLRQGCAIAFDALMARVSGTLYDTAAKRNRFFLETFIHEVGHNFNLPHTWQRGLTADSASNSFMNYPWGYTGGAGTETAFWSNFRWEFDDVEIAWLRHANRPDIIFGGNNWVWNNLSMFPNDEVVAPKEMGVRLEIRSVPVFDFAEPVHVELKLKNIAAHVIKLPAYLRPEDGLVTLAIKRPDGTFAQHVAPVRSDRSYDATVSLQPGMSLYESVPLSVGARGQQFTQPGEYIVKAYGMIPGRGMVVSKPHRFRISAPFNRESEELAYTMFDYKAAKILYLGGSKRYTETMSALEEVSGKYAKSNPSTIRHIHAALGSFYKNDFKFVVKSKDAWTVRTEKADTKKAILHLGNARALLYKGEMSPLGHIAYNRVSSDLVDVQLKMGKKEEAKAVLKESIAYFEQHKVLSSIIDNYKKRLSALQKKVK